MARIVKSAAIAAGVLVAAAITLSLMVDANTFRPALERELTGALGREVKLGDLKLAIFSGGVTANDLSIADDPSYGRAPFVQAKSVKIGVELLPLIFSHRLNVTAVTIDEPQIALIESPSGEWN